MRAITWWYFVPLALTIACGDDGSRGDDGDAGPTLAEPRIIPGGGIGDGPIDGVVNVYVIDDDTREPVEGATVHIGDTDHTSDADGLVRVLDLTGPQSVVVKAAGYRGEMWVGANGANLTFNLEQAAMPAVKTATVTGSLSVATLPALPANHVYFASVKYSQDDLVTDEENNLLTVGETNNCPFLVQANACNFTITTRVGKLALFAQIIDVDTKGTGPILDDTYAPAGWALRGNVTTTESTTSSGQNLTLVPSGQLEAVQVDFGTPPGTLAEVAAFVGIDTGDNGTLQVGLFVPPDSGTVSASQFLPAISSLTGATTRRLTGIASDGAEDPLQSVVLRRGFTAALLAAGSWLPPPSTTLATRTDASWAPIDGALITSVEYTQGTARVINISVFDDSTAVSVPSLVTVPAGAIKAKIQGLSATDLDVTDFSIDRDRLKLDRVCAKTIAIP